VHVLATYYESIARILGYRKHDTARGEEGLLYGTRKQGRPPFLHIRPATLKHSRDPLFDEDVLLLGLVDEQEEGRSRRDRLNHESGGDGQLTREDPKACHTERPVRHARPGGAGKVSTIRVVGGR
jgi:hypothetical protein